MKINQAMSLAMLLASISVAQAQTRETAASKTAAPATAESDSAGQVQEIIVTGSRIRRDALTVGILFLKLTLPLYRPFAIDLSADQATSLKGNSKVHVSLQPSTWIFWLLANNNPQVSASL